MDVLAARPTGGIFMGMQQIFLMAMLASVLYAGVYLMEFLIAKIEQKPYQKPSGWDLLLCAIVILVFVIGILIRVWA